MGKAGFNPGPTALKANTLPLGHWDSHTKPWVKLLKAQNMENQVRVQGPTRPWWGAGEKPPQPKTHFSFFTANLGALLAPMRQKCKQQQVSQRSKKRPKKRIFCSLKSLHESYTITLWASELLHNNNKKQDRNTFGKSCIGKGAILFWGKGGGLKFQNKDFLIWRFPESGILLWGGKVSPMLYMDARTNHGT